MERTPAIGATRAGDATDRCGPHVAVLGRTGKDRFWRVRNHPPKSPRSALSHCRTANSATRDSHHEPARAPGKSIEPGHAPIPPAFSPTEFLRRLRSAETLISFACHRAKLKPSRRSMAILA